jgi:hypothetical protein
VVVLSVGWCARHVSGLPGLTLGDRHRSVLVQAIRSHGAVLHLTDVMMRVDGNN